MRNLILKYKIVNMCATEQKAYRSVAKKFLTNISIIVQAHKGIALYEIFCAVF